MDEGEHLWLSTTKACQYLGLSKDTLFRLEREKIIKCYQTKPLTGHKRWDVKSFKGFQDGSKPQPDEKRADEIKSGDDGRKGVCYCRVSTRAQADDLRRQVQSMREKFPEFEIIQDFGSGINYKRKGLLRLLKGAIEKRFSTVVVSHRDRLTRFGFELFEWLLEYYGVKLLVLEQKVGGSREDELCKDLLSI